MRSVKRGFTLIEVIVALAICSGALLMLASVSNESLRRSVHARQQAMLNEACRNRLAEYACGADPDREGEFSDLPGWRWQVQIEAVPMDDISGLERVTLSAWASDGSGPERRMAVLRYRPEERP